MEQTTFIETAERKKIRKAVRKDGSWTGFGSLIYTFLLLIVSYIGMYLVVPLLGDKVHNSSTEELLRLIMDHPVTGIVSIVGSLFALFVLFLCFKKSKAHKELFRKNKSMTLARLGGLLCVMYLFNSIGSIFYQLIENNLNFFGLSTDLGAEIASGSSSNLPMFLYASFIGPIVEELVFRGLLMRRLQKHGKLLAILATSLLFGLMHENLPQVMTATLIGFVLGYIAMEYSVIWSIVLHIFHNFVMCDLMTRALDGSSELTTYWVMQSFAWVTAIIGIAALIRNRKSIVAWVRGNLMEKRTAVWVFTSVGLVIAVLYHLYNTISFITPI